MQAGAKVAGLALNGSQSRLSALDWRKRVRVERTGDIRDATRRFWRPGSPPGLIRFRIVGCILAHAQSAIVRGRYTTEKERQRNERRRKRRTLWKTRLRVG